MAQQALAVVCSSLAKTWWLRSPHFQRFQTRLPFFSKSFSPFPHGTCLLSALSPCVALDEAYHQHCAPVPRSVAPRMCTVHRGLPLTNGALTLAGTRFQETCRSSRDYSSGPLAQIFMLSKGRAPCPLARAASSCGWPTKMLCALARSRSRSLSLSLCL